MVSLIGGSNVNAMEVRVSGDTTDLQNSLDEAAMAIAGFKTQVAALGTGAAIAGAAGIAAATQAARTWNEVQREMHKVTDAETAKELGEAMRNLSRDIPVATNELGKLAADAARFGIEGKENIEKFTRSVAKMAAATDLTTDEAGEAFAKLSAITDTPAAKMENLGSSIALLENNFATSASEIAEASLRASASMNRMGASQTEIVALSTALNEVNPSARRAGTGLRRVAQEMMDPKNVGDLASSLGATEEEFANMREQAPVKTMMQLATTFQEGGKRADFVSAAMSTFAERTLAQLAGNLDAAKEAMDKSNKAFNEATQLQREYEIQTDSLDAQLQRLINSLRDTAITVGNVFIPVLKDAIDAILPVLDRFDEWVNASDGVKQAMILVGTTIAGVIPILGLFVQLMPSLTTTLYAGTAALISLTSTVAATVGPVVALGIAFKRNFMGIRESIMSVVDVFKNEFQATVEEVSKTVRLIAGSLMKAWEEHGDTIESTIRAIIETIEGGLISAIRTAGNIIRSGLRDFRSWWRAHGEAVANIVVSMANGVISIFKDAVEGISALIRGDLGSAADSWESILKTIKSATITALGAIWVAVEESFSRMEDRVASSSLLPFWKNTLLDLLRLTQSIGAAVVNVFYGATEDAVVALENAGESLVSIAQRVFYKISVIAEDAFGLVLDAIRNSNIPILWRMTLIDVLTATRSLGGAISNALHGAFGDAVTSMENAGERMNKAATRTFSILETTVKNTAKKALGILVLAIKANKDKIVDIWNKLPGEVRSALLDLAIVLQSHREKVDSVKEDIKGILESLSSIWERHVSSVELSVAGIAVILINHYARVIDWTATVVEKSLDRMNRSLKKHKDKINKTISKAKSFFKKYGSTIAKLTPVILGLVFVTKKLVGPISWLIGGLASIAAIISPVIRGFGLLALAIADIFRWINNLLGLTSILGNAFASIRLAIGRVIGAIGSWSLSVSNIMYALGGLAALLGGPVSTALAIVAIAASVLAGSWLRDFKGMKKAAEQWGSKVNKIIEDIVAIFNNLLQPIIKEVEKTWQKHGDTVESVLKRISRLVIGTVRLIVNIILSVLVPAFDEFRKFMKAHGDEIAFILMGILKVVGFVVGGIVDFLLDVLIPVLDWVEQKWKKWGDEIVAAIRFAMSGALGVIGAILDAIVALFRAAGAAISGNWGKALNILYNLVVDILTGIIDWVKQWNIDIWIARKAAQAVDMAAGWLNKLPGVNIKVGKKMKKAVDQWEVGRAMKRKGKNAKQKYGQATKGINQDWKGLLNNVNTTTKTSSIDTVTQSKFQSARNKSQTPISGLGTDVNSTISGIETNISNSDIPSNFRGEFLEAKTKATGPLSQMEMEIDTTMGNIGNTIETSDVPSGTKRVWRRAKKKQGKELTGMETNTSVSAAEMARTIGNMKAGEKMGMEFAGAKEEVDLQMGKMETSTSTGVGNIESTIRTAKVHKAVTAMMSQSNQKLVASFKKMQTAVTVELRQMSMSIKASGGLIANAMKVFARMGTQAFIKQFKKLGSQLTRRLNTIINGPIRSFGTRINTAFFNIGRSLQATTRAIWNRITRTSISSITSLKTVIVGNLQSITVASRAQLQGLALMFRLVWGRIRTQTAAQWTRIAATVQRSLSRITTIIQASMIRIQSLLSRSLVGIARQWRAQFNRILAVTQSSWQSILVTFRQALTSILRLLSQSAIQMRTIVTDTMKFITATFLRALTRIRAIVTASFRVIVAIITRSMTIIRDIIVRTAEMILTTFVRTLTLMLGQARTILRVLESVFATSMRRIVAIIRNGMRQSVSAMASGLSSMRSRAETILSSIVSAFRSAFSTISAIAANIVSTAESAANRAEAALRRAAAAARAAQAAANRAESAASAAASASSSASREASQASSAARRAELAAVQADQTGFAHGGIVTSPTRAIIGEGGDDEAVIPLNKRGKDFMRDALGGMGDGSGINIERMQIYANSRAGGRAVARGLKDELRSHNFD